MRPVAITSAPFSGRTVRRGTLVFHTTASSFAFSSLSERYTCPDG
jgi:hypothetical protein